MVKEGKNKKGISPMIATVILIAIVIAIALILFLWFRNMVKEDAKKFEDESIELTCTRVKFNADYNSGQLVVVNEGSLPIYALKIALYSEGGHSEISKEPSNDEGLAYGINQGGVYATGLDGSGLNKVIVYPVLIGKAREGTRTHVCKKQGLEINL